MRLFVPVFLLLIPAEAVAQTTTTDPSVARILPNSSIIQATQTATQSSRTTTLASGSRKKDAPVSRNEAYNVSRAAEGRVGVRVGNDVSFSVSRPVGQ